MKHHLQAILLGTVLAAALGACSSTASHKDAAGSTATSGSSGASGTTSSGSDVDTHGNNSRLTPPPVVAPSSTGTVIDDRINENKSVPGQNP
jgi:hypothetical protein